jgi:hypothetical protein
LAAEQPAQREAYFVPGSDLLRSGDPKAQTDDQRDCEFHVSVIVAASESIPAGNNFHTILHFLREGQRKVNKWTRQ